MDMTFFTFICCKNCIVCLKRPKINKKEARVGPILKKINVLEKFAFDGVSNRGPLVSEATAMPTEPQPLPLVSHQIFCD